MTESDARSRNEPWFSGRPGTILLYRVNRRPLAQASLFSGQQPEDVFDHLVEVLLFGQEVETGRRSKRYWRLGNRGIREGERVLTGQIGWQSTAPEAADRYDPSAMEWSDSLGERGRTARAPFAFEADGRTLAVLKHPSFSERTIPHVFRELLQDGERARDGGATTDWDVEPLLDAEDFRGWLQSVDVVDRVQFTAKLPNPDGLEEFGQVWDRMDQHRAKLLREIMEGADPDVGLVGLEQDRVVNNYIAMSENAFGYVKADGRRDGHRTRFDQQSAVARRQTEDLPSSWGEVIDVVVGFARERRRQQRGT
ncbi:MAG: hypothetical protein OJJ54_20880 [Pseudonocardia sp.]|nr:hypothetical protein [Pseudonocardia sp.]